MEDFSEQQQLFMRRAIEIGERGRITTPPNPWVGCVLVKNGKILSEGYHEYPGGPHAEEIAIRKAHVSLEGAQVYLSLEPCSHYGKQPPCTDLLIKHRVAEVFIALKDPDCRVSGKGIESLKNVGIRVHVGLEEARARKSLQPYLYQRSSCSPWVVLKSAASIDGQVADRNSQSQWITCPEARHDVGFIRACSQAVIVGAGTVIADNPKLTARRASGELYARQPLRVVLDSSGRVPKESQVFHLGGEVLYVTTKHCPSQHLQYLEALGVEIACVKASSSGVDLHEVMRLLANKHFLQVLVEGGATVHTEFLKHHLANAIILYYGPKILGDQKKPLFKELGDCLHTAQAVLPLSADFVGNSLKVFWEIPLKKQG